jgi:hypothetical protein
MQKVPKITIYPKCLRGLARYSGTLFEKAEEVPW